MDALDVVNIYHVEGHQKKALAYLAGGSNEDIGESSLPCWMHWQFAEPSNWIKNDAEELNVKDQMAGGGVTVA